MQRTSRRLAIALAAAGALSLLPGAALGAGRADQSPDQLLRQVQADLADVRSFHVEGTSRDDDGTTKLSADVTSTGSVALKGRLNRADFELRKVQDNTFLRGDAAFWRAAGGASGGKVARLLADRWIHLPAADAQEFAALYERLTPKGLGACTFNDLGTITKAGTGTAGGRKAVVLRDRGDKPGSSPGRLWIAATGPALPLRATQTGRERPGGSKDPACGDDDEPDTTTRADLRFSDFNKAPSIRAPRGAVDLDELTGAGGETQES